MRVVETSLTVKPPGAFAIAVYEEAFRRDLIRRTPVAHISAFRQHELPSAVSISHDCRAAINLFLAANIYLLIRRRVVVLSGEAVPPHLHRC